MTIRDPLPRMAPNRRHRVLGVVALALVAGFVAELAGCGQKGPLRLPAQPHPAASVGTTVPGSSSTTPDAGRDPFSNPSPTALPASVPRP